MAEIISTRNKPGSATREGPLSKCTADEWYANKVYNYSRRDASAEYFCGIHYSRLGSFLISPFKARISHSSSSPQESPFAFATLCDLAKKHGDPVRTQLFSEPLSFSQSINALGLDDMRRRPRNSVASSNKQSSHAGQTSNNAGRMVFLRGYPSPEWLNHIGAALDVDPEFWHRHLDESASLSPTQPGLDSYLTPYPPSGDIIQLRLPNTGCWKVRQRNITLASLRQMCKDSMRQHISDFMNFRRFSLGDSVVRRFILHDKSNFTIEQKITIEVIHHTNPWSIIVWMDVGTDLGLCVTGPWLDKFGLTGEARLHPTFQFRERMALSKHSKAGPSMSAGASTGQRYTQSASHMPGNYGRYLQPGVMGHDPFYALHELFDISASATDQYLERLENTTRAVLLYPSAEKVTELLSVKATVDDYTKYTKDVLDIVRARGNNKWPRASPSSDHQARVENAANELQRRYERLARRCDRLSDQCGSNISIAMSLEEGRKSEAAMKQADRLGKLSFLAYVYIPISFAASFFGMNFAELGSELSIWAFFVMASVLLFISLLAWFVDIGLFFERMFGLCTNRARKFALGRKGDEYMV